MIFVVLPLVILAGLAMSPGMDAAFPWIVDVLGGRQSARTIHFIAATAIVLFVIVHVIMVLISGVFNNLRSMITGRYAVRTEEESQ
jgi:thiosulfate reductase cytochrome b subunit